jgi:hypothetical protein
MALIGQGSVMQSLAAPVGCCRSCLPLGGWGLSRSPSRWARRQADGWAMRTRPPGFGRGRRGDGRVLRQESPATRASGDVHYPERAHRGGATDDNAATIGRTARPSGVDDAPHVDQLLTHGGRDVALMRSLSKAGVEHSTLNRPGRQVACHHQAVRGRYGSDFFTARQQAVSRILRRCALAASTTAADSAAAFTNEAILGWFGIIPAVSP